MSNPIPNIRLATPHDLAAINAIYNHYVLTSTSTYQETPTSDEERQRWFAERSDEHPVTVATIRDEVVGWGSLSVFRRRTAYRRTVENSVYVRPDMHRNGIGRLLLSDLIERAGQLGHHAIIAMIDAEQLPSIALHKALAFEEVGRLREVGFKFDRWLDVVYLQLLIQHKAHSSRFAV